MKALSISESEWAIMKVVWEGEPIATAEIVSALTESQGWHSRTIRTMLDRLVKKGALGFRIDGKRYIYSAVVSQVQCAHQERRSLIDRVFGGDSAAMIVNAVKETRLSEADIAELQRLLKEKKR